MAVEVCGNVCVKEREREREKVATAICRIITGCSARLNEAEGGDIWWHILGNCVRIRSVQVRVSVCACRCVHTLIHVKV